VLNALSALRLSLLFVKVGHFVDLKIQTRTRPLDAEAVCHAMESFNPLAAYDLPSRPLQPIVVTREPGRPRPKVMSIVLSAKAPCDRQPSLLVLMLSLNGVNAIFFVSAREWFSYLFILRHAFSSA